MYNLKNILKSKVPFDPSPSLISFTTRMKWIYYSLLMTNHVNNFCQIWNLYSKIKSIYMRKGHHIAIFVTLKIFKMHSVLWGSISVHELFEWKTYRSNDLKRQSTNTRMTNLHNWKKKWNLHKFQRCYHSEIMSYVKKDGIHSSKEP